MRKIALFFALIAIAGCAGRTGPRPEVIEAKNAELANQSRSKIVDVVDAPYLGALPVPLPKQGGEQAAILGAQVTLRMRGTLDQLCAAISDLAPLSVTAERDAPQAALVKKPNQGKPDMPADLAALLDSAGELGGATKTVEINYAGTLRGLLDAVGAQFGLGWQYSATDGTIAFSRYQVRTFTLLSAPGKLNYSNQITNKSRETTQSSVASAGSVQQAVSSGDASSQTAQTNAAEVQLDAWKEAQDGVKALLSKGGSVVGNQTAGTLTVKDSSVALKQIAAYIDELNAKLARQVALSVKVWSLEMSDNTDVGLNLQVLFEQGSVAVASGGSPLSFLQSGGDLTATIVDGRLKGSQALLKALRSIGNATQVSSGGGVVMNNTPVPVQAITKDTYLAGTSKTQTEFGITSDPMPGEVTTGFAMTVIPHILERRRVILQYNINLSTLDDMVEETLDGTTIKFPKTSNNSFANRVTLKMGQTLVLAGFEKERDASNTQVGAIGAGKTRQYGRSVILVTIEVESGDV